MTARHKGLVYVDDAVLARHEAELEAVARSARAIERETDLEALRRSAVETDLGPAVLLRDVERILTTGGQP